MTDVAAHGWVVRATILEEAGKPTYRYFLTGCDTDTEAVAAVRSFPGIVQNDALKVMRPLSSTELNEFTNPLKAGEVRLHE